MSETITYNPNWRLQKESCATCNRGVDEDGYGECEVCGKFFCAEHNELTKGICPECIKSVKEAV